MRPLVEASERRIRRPRPAGLLLTAALAAVLAAGACEVPGGGAWLDAAAEAHRRADEAVARGDRVAALAALATFVDAPRPPSLAGHDRRIVVQDAYFRLAVLALEDGDPAASRAWADRGLLAGHAADVFTANLLVARGKALEASGDAAQAAMDYLAAQRIGERLLEQALGSGEGARP